MTRYLLVYRDEALGAAWREEFHGQAEVSVVAGDITRTACDAVVSPANSFGFMDGGLDLALSERLGWGMSEELRRRIRELPEEELLVGRAMIVPTGNSEVPWLVAAPTMRIPMRIPSTVNAYLAMKAVLLAVRGHSGSPPIRFVAVPGLGTGVGKLPPAVAAKQMAAAYRQIVLGERFCPDDLGDAIDQHLALNPDSRLFPD